MLETGKDWRHRGIYLNRHCESLEQRETELFGSAFEIRIFIRYRLSLNAEDCMQQGFQVSVSATVTCMQDWRTGQAFDQAIDLMKKSL